MGHVSVKYTLKGKVLSNDEVEENKHLYDPRCFQSKQKNRCYFEASKTTE